MQYVSLRLAFPLSTIPGSSKLLQVSIACSSLLWSTIPWYGCTTSPPEGHVDSFQFEVIVSKAAMNNDVQTSA